MTIEQALLSARDHLKLNLLLTLIETTPKTDLTQFAVAQQLNYAQAYNLLTALTIDLQQAGYEASMEGGQLTTTITVDQYRQWLYQSTIAYQCLMSSLMGEYASAADFCAAKKISSSTLQRHLQNLRPMFQQLHLRFSPQKFTLLGDETNLQIFYYQFLTSTFTILPTNPKFLSWRAQVQQAYQRNGQVQLTIGIQQQQQQILNLSLLRLQQGYPLTSVTMVPAPKISLSRFQSSLERWFALTSQQASQHLQTLNYLLTWSPLSISSMRPLTLLQSPPTSQTTSWLLAQNAGQLTVGPSNQDWLQAVTLFIINFGVSPLLNLPQVDHSADATFAQTITAVIDQFQQRYHCQLSGQQLRLLEQLLPAYCQALTPVD